MALVMAGPEAQVEGTSAAAEHAAEQAAQLAAQQHSHDNAFCQMGASLRAAEMKSGEDVGT